MVDNQGFPDLTLIYKGKVAILEVKRSEAEYILEQVTCKKVTPRTHNQRYYVNIFNETGTYAAFIYPENMATIVNELRKRLGN